MNKFKYVKLKCVKDVKFHNEDNSVFILCAKGETYIGYVLNNEYYDVVSGYNSCRFDKKEIDDNFEIIEECTINEFEYIRLKCIHDMYADNNVLAYKTGEYYRGCFLDTGEWEIHSNDDRAKGCGWIFPYEEFKNNFDICV